MGAAVVSPDELLDALVALPVGVSGELAARFDAEFAAEWAELEAAGAVVPPDDLFDLDDPGVPVLVSVEELFDVVPPMSRVDALEWELWAGVDQDEAERAMLRREAPAWVFLPPGGELAAALEPVRPQWESPVALIELMKAASRLSSWAESIKAAAMASFFRQRQAQSVEVPRPGEVDGSGRPVDPERSWVAEIGVALQLSRQTAARNVDTALHLTGPLTATLAGLRSGALTWSKVLSISEATRSLPDEAARAVESHVLGRAAGQTHANLRRSLRTQVAKHAAPAEAERHRDAAKHRTCKIVALSDGMAGLWVVHTADKIQQMWVVIQAMATLAKRPTPPTPTTAAGPTPDGTTADPTPSTAAADPGPYATTADRTPDTAATDRVPDATTAEPVPYAASADRMPDATTARPAQPDADPAPGDGPVERSAEQRRADVVADLFEQMLRNGIDWLGRRLPDQHRRRPHIEVLIPATTLLGLDNTPCELTGYGPIPADLARQIAADGTWRRLLTDPTNGTVLEASTTRHDPSTLVSETLLARHPVCAWPGCNHPARDCDRDHTTPFAITGHTTLTGLAPYCEYHHIIKDTPAWGWTTTNHPDGSITLTTPTGHCHTTTPPTRGPITHPATRTPPPDQAPAADQAPHETPAAGPAPTPASVAAPHRTPAAGPTSASAHPRPPQPPSDLPPF